MDQKILIFTCGNHGRDSVWTLYYTASQISIFRGAS